MSDVSFRSPAPWRHQFDNARDPYMARNALGIPEGGGGGAPTDAQYIVAVDDPTLTNDRVLTNTATVTWDFSTAGQAKANVTGGGGNVSNVGTPTSGQYAKWTGATTIQGVAPATVLSDIGAQPAGSYGDVTGPASATDEAVVRFDGTTGKLVQNSSSGPWVTDAGEIYVNSQTAIRKRLQIGADANDPLIQNSTTGGHLRIRSNGTSSYVLSLEAASDRILLSTTIGPTTYTESNASLNASGTLYLADGITRIAGIGLIQHSANAGLCFPGRPATDELKRDLWITGAAAKTTAVTNLSGGHIRVSPGHGASASAGLANGGNLYLDGGRGYGTGNHGRVTVGASYGYLNLPHTIAPTTPINGDLWTTTAGLFAQINGGTVGPFGTGGGGGSGNVSNSGTPTAGQIAQWTDATHIQGVAPSFGPPQGRLTLQSATPVMTTTQSAKTTIYYTPYIGNLVPIYGGTNFVMTSIGSEISVATTDTTKSPAAIGASKVNDWYVWLDGSTVRLSHGPDWTNDTTRSAAIYQLAGIWCNLTNITNGPLAGYGTYVGTTRSNASNTLDWQLPSVGAGVGNAVLGVWNAYNRVHAGGYGADTTASWTYNSTTIRQRRATTTAQVQFVSGLAEDLASMIISQTLVNNADNTTGIIGIGVDTTTVFTGAIGFGSSAPSIVNGSTARHMALSLGNHVWTANEACNTASTVTFRGAVAGPPARQESGYWFNFPM